MLSNILLSAVKKLILWPGNINLNVRAEQEPDEHKRSISFDPSYPLKQNTGDDNSHFIFGVSTHAAACSFTSLPAAHLSSLLQLVPHLDGIKS